MGDMRNAYRIFVGKPGEKEPLGRHRHRWEDNIRMDLSEIRCVLDSPGSLVNTVSIKGGEFFDWVNGC
jgi:hypothetical protein